MVSLAAGALAGPAHANGRPPAPTQVHFSPVSANDIYLQVTFGLLESHDAGATWRWACEEAIGYSGLYDPDYVISSTGALIATTFDGLEVRHDGCVFGGTNLTTSFATTVTSNAAGTVIYAGVSEPSTHDHKIYKSTDDGATYLPTGATTPGDEASWTDLEVAPSDDNVLYAAGYRFPPAVPPQPPPPRQVTLYTSVNGGGEWTALSTASLTTSPYSNLLVTISPDDPKLAILTVTHPKGQGVGNALYRTIDGGGTWTQVKELDDYVPGVVIRKLTGAGPAATKATVVLGTTNTGIWSSTDGGQTFTQTVAAPPASVHVQCMEEKAGTLWACADNLPPDSMALGKSPTAGNWIKVLEFKDIAGTLACAAGTVEEDTCDVQRWCFLRDQLGIIANPTSCMSVGADASLVDAGPVDANGGGGGKKGCCDAGGGPAGASALSLLVLATFLRRGRRSLHRRH